MGKQKEFLDKVIYHILKKTDIDYDIKQITNWPFYRNGMGFNVFMSAPHSAFGILERHFYFYCKEVYGLTKEESKYVWEGYINMLGETIKLIGGNINESGDKQQNFFDKVLDRIVKDTNITDSWITFPFANFKNPELSSDSLLSVSTWIDGRWENHKYPHRFNKYCMDIYGLTYMESLGLWNSYMEIIEEEVNKRLKRPLSDFYNMDLNESVDKQKEFLDKVVQHAVERFKDKDKGELQYYIDMDDFIGFGDNFGLTELELNYIYNKYRFLKGWASTDISSFFLDNNNSLDNRRMNESMDTHHLKYFIKDLNDKQKNYINKIIEHLVNDTVIDYPLRRIHYPFKGNHTGRNDTFTFSYIYPFSGPFIRYCNDLFPLSKDEMKYVHGMYIANIYKKVSDYFIENDLYHSHYNVNGTKDIISFDQ